MRELASVRLLPLALVSPMPGPGFEPGRGCPQEILSLERLPVSPPGRVPEIYLSSPGDPDASDESPGPAPGPRHAARVPGAAWAPSCASCPGAAPGPPPSQVHGPAIPP